MVVIVAFVFYLLHLCFVMFIVRLFLFEARSDVIPGMINSILIVSVISNTVLSCRVEFSSCDVICVL